MIYSGNLPLPTASIAKQFNMFLYGNDMYNICYVRG
jgi:hypothetical protein